MAKWFLESYDKETQVLTRIRIDQTPFTVGRLPGLPLGINSRKISRSHAVFITTAAGLTLSDQRSTNGTFINHKPIGTNHPLKHGDIIHFADAEYRLIEESLPENLAPNNSFGETAELTGPLQKGANELQELLHASLLTADFQEIVSDQGNAVFGYESLGRGFHPLLPANPGGLFPLAESSGTAVILSEMMRTAGVALAVINGIKKPLFVNTHPQELQNHNRLLKSLFSLRNKYPAINLVLEIPEETVENHQTMTRIKRELKSLEILMAYDAFGADQNRLRKLLRTPPDFLKFKMNLLQGLSKSPNAHWHKVETLIHLSKDAGITVTAEGIDCREDAEACSEIGFDYQQGYYFSPTLRPVPFPAASP